MSYRFGFRKIFLVIVVLMLAQFACTFPLPPSTKGSKSTQAPASLSASSSGSQVTEPPAAQPTSSNAAQATQPAAPSTTTTSKYGTPEQALTMLQKAVEHYNSVGRKQALTDFNHGVAPFYDRDLYVACIDANLKQSANGGYPNLVGTTIEPISRAAWNAATTDKVGTVNYEWLDPATGTTLPKTFYYEKVGSDVCGVGAYHP